jgi:hypothetical protein
MVGYAWMNALHSIGVVATLTPPYKLISTFAHHAFGFAGST